MAKITLGGERLGSGKKIEINIPEFNRSSHDQGFVFTSDQAFGTLVPALCNIGTRGDVFYLDDIASIVRTLPTNGPVFGSVKQQIDVFCAPVRLYNGALHNNATGIGLKMQQIKFPVKRHITTVYPDDTLTKNANLKSVAPDCLDAYLGSKGSRTGVDWTNIEYTENAIFELMYWDIYKNYYANKQEEEGVVIKSATTTKKTLESVYFQSQGETIVTQTGENTLNGEISSWTSANIVATDKIIWSTTRELSATEKEKLFFNANNEEVHPTKWPSLFTMISKQAGDKWVYEAECISNTNYRPNLSATTGLAGGAEWRDEVNMTLQRFPLTNIDKMREAILAQPIGVPLVINEVGNGSKGMIPYNTQTEEIIDEENKKRESRYKTMCGLGIKCHLSDMYNNWLQTDWIDGDNGINDLTSIDTTTGNFTINEFLLDYKLFKMMNRIAISDGSYDGWQTAVYGQEGRVITESPVYCGGYSSEISFDEVVSQSATQDEPLGSLAGRGSQQNQTRQGGKNIKIVCDEAMLIMVISSFTPRITYSQNKAWWLDLESINDLHKPDLDGIAFQNLTAASMLQSVSGITAEGKRQDSGIGKQTAWLEYTTAVNQSFGDFAAGMPLEHLVLNRSYQMKNKEVGIKNATTYIDPTEFNVIFADTELTAKPFWVQIGFNLTSRRKMSAAQIPNL